MSIKSENEFNDFYDDLIHKQVIEQLEMINNSSLSDKYYRRIANTIVKGLLDSVSRRRYERYKDTETKRIYDIYHKDYCELEERTKNKFNEIMNSKKIKQ